jgi:hypothetical protein
MSKVIVEGVWAEELFRWFTDHVDSSCGDGAGAIVCKNYKEAAKIYQDWYLEECGKPIWHPWHEYDDIVNFHDGNENFIFTNDPNIFLHDGDYVFVVNKDCHFGGDRDKKRTLIGIQ